MKKILILLVIFAGLLALVYFYEIKGGKEREEAKEKEQSVVQLERNDINEIHIERSGAQPIVLKRTGTDWSVRQPVETPADASTVDGLLTALGSARIERRLEQAGKEASKYGLDPPRVRLTLKSAKEQKTLRFGSKDFTGNQVYVQLEGRPDILLTSDYLFNSASKELNDWRSRKVLSFDRAQVQNIEINRPGEQVRLRRQGEQWMLESPLQESADDGAVSSLLSTLESAEAQKFVAEQPGDLKTYGLDKPSVTVRVREQGKDSWKSLELGNKEQETYLARNTERLPVFTVKSEVYDKLAQKIWEFRDKRIVDVDQDKVAEMMVKRADAEIVIKHDKDKWLVQKPESAKGKEALTYKFWYPLVDAKYQSLEEPAAGAAISEPGKPDVQVTLTLKDGTRKSYAFFHSGDKYLAFRPDTKRMGAISKESFDALQFKAEDII